MDSPGYSDLEQEFAASSNPAEPFESFPETQLGHLLLPESSFSGKRKRPRHEASLSPPARHTKSCKCYDENTDVMDEAETEEEEQEEGDLWGIQGLNADAEGNVSVKNGTEAEAEADEDMSGHAANMHLLELPTLDQASVSFLNSEMVTHMDSSDGLLHDSNRPAEQGNVTVDYGTDIDINESIEFLLDNVSLSGSETTPTPGLADEMDGHAFMGGSIQGAGFSYASAGVEMETSAPAASPLLSALGLHAGANSPLESDLASSESGDSISDLESLRSYGHTDEQGGSGAAASGFTNGISGDNSSGIPSGTASSNMEEMGGPPNMTAPTQAVQGALSLGPASSPAILPPTVLVDTQLLNTLVQGVVYARQPHLTYEVKGASIFNTIVPTEIGFGFPLYTFVARNNAPWVSLLMATAQAMRSGWTAPVPTEPAPPSNETHPGLLSAQAGADLARNIYRSNRAVEIQHAIAQANLRAAACARISAEARAAMAAEARAASAAAEAAAGAELAATIAANGGVLLTSANYELPILGAYVRDGSQIGPLAYAMPIFIPTHGSYYISPTGLSLMPAQSPLNVHSPGPLLPFVVPPSGGSSPASEMSEEVEEEEEVPLGEEAQGPEEQAAPMDLADLPFASLNPDSLAYGEHVQYPEGLEGLQDLAFQEQQPQYPVITPFASEASEISPPMVQLQVNVPGSAPTLILVPATAPPVAPAQNTLPPVAPAQAAANPAPSMASSPLSLADDDDVPPVAEVTQNAMSGPPEPFPLLLPVPPQHHSLLFNQNSGLNHFVFCFVQRVDLLYSNFPGGRVAAARTQMAICPKEVLGGHLAGDQRDFQGINWISMGLRRDDARIYRTKTYRNYTSLPMSDRWTVDYCAMPPRNTESYFCFEKMLLKRDVHMAHFQLRHLLANCSRTRAFYVTHLGHVNELNLLTGDTSLLLRLGSSIPERRIASISANNKVLVAGGFSGDFAISNVNSEYIEDRRGEAHAKGFLVENSSAISNHIEIHHRRGSAGPVATFATNDGCLRTLDIATATVTSCLQFDYTVNCTALSPDQRLRLVVGDSTDACIVPADDGRVQGGGWRPQILHRLQGHRDYGFSCAWADDGFTMATGNQDMAIKIWDMRKLHNAAGLSLPVTTLRSEMAGVRSLRFSPVGAGKRLLVAAEEADFLHVIDAQSFRAMQTFDIFGEIGGTVLANHGQDVLALCTDPHRGGVLQFKRCGAELEETWRDERYGAEDWSGGNATAVATTLDWHDASASSWRTRQRQSQRRLRAAAAARASMF